MTVLFKELKLSLRYKYTTLNRIFSSFFIIFPYVLLAQTGNEKIEILKNMICWYWLVQLMFNVGGYIQDERQNGTFINTILFPKNIYCFIFDIYLFTVIDCLLMTITTLILASLFGIIISNAIEFFIILLIQSIPILSLSIFHCSITILFKKTGGYNSLIQHVLGAVSGYTGTINSNIIRIISFLVPLTFSIKFSSFGITPKYLYIEFFIAILMFVFANNVIKKVLYNLRLNGEIDKW